MLLLSKIFYFLGVRLYYIAIYLASFFNEKAKQWIKGRKIPVQNIIGKSIWFHCASLGEFEQARPLIEQIKKENPEEKIVLTFFSPSGYEIRKNYALADFVYYLPLDTSKNAQNFIQKIKPKQVFFIKYEFWHCFLQTLKQENIPTYLVAGIFREKQLFFKPYGIFYRNILKNFSHLFVQDQKSLALLQKIGLKNISQANDPRFDRVLSIKNQAKKFPEIEKFVGNKKCIVLGSTWLADEKLFAQCMDMLKDYQLIIAPHDISAKRIKEVQQIFKNNVLFSEISKAYSPHTQCLIIDNMGMLSSIYAYGNYAYIGGGFGVSIHNILEAGVYHIPVVFGTAHHKMKEATDLIQLGGGFVVNNLEELRNRLQAFQKEEFLAIASQKAGAYVQKNSGGTRKVLDFVKK